MALWVLKSFGGICMASSNSEQMHAVEHHDQASSHISKNRHPERGFSCKRQDEKYRLDADGQRDVLPQHAGRIAA